MPESSNALAAATIDAVFMVVLPAADHAVATRAKSSLAPAVQLFERVEAACEIGEERESRAFVSSRTLRRYRTQQLRDRGMSRIAMPSMEEFEDLLLEILQPHAHTHAAGAARAEHDVPLSELGPFAEESRGFENRGQTTFCAISLRKPKTWAVPGFH